MFSVTRTEPVAATRPTSLRPRSISITCSARSFGSASSSAASASSSSGVLPRGRVPAIGRSVTLSPSRRTRISGRRADHVEILEVEVEHVRRRIERAQRAVERQRVGANGLRQALRQHHLHHVAVGDVFLGALAPPPCSLLRRTPITSVSPACGVSGGICTVARSAQAVRAGALAPSDTRPARPARHRRPGSACRRGCRRWRFPRTASAGCRACRAWSGGAVCARFGSI